MQLTRQSPWLQFYKVLASGFGCWSYYVVCTRRLVGTWPVDFGTSIASTLEEIVDGSNKGDDMRWKQIENEPKVFALIFETDDEIASVLQKFSKEQGLAGSSFKAIGALSYAKLGWFNWDTKKYEPASVLDEQVELLSLIGDIALRDGEPQVPCPRGSRTL